MAARTSVTASVVRTWATANPVKDDSGEVIALGQRGRIPAPVIAAFHKANPRQRYIVAGEAQVPTVSFTIPATDSIGRNRTKRVTITTAEARAVMGHEPGRKGRFDLDALATAYVAASKAA